MRLWGHSLYTVPPLISLFFIARITDLFVIRNNSDYDLFVIRINSDYDLFVIRINSKCDLWVIIISGRTV